MRTNAATFGCGRAYISRQLINEYRAELDRLRAVTGSTRETNLRPAFARLLRAWGKQALDLVFVEEYQLRTQQGNLISVDGALLHALRVPFGNWEAKDERDDLDAEIEAKFRKGYPRDNIIFSDDRTAVLVQDGIERARVAMDDTDALSALLTRFFAHERQEIADFNKAVKQFATDLPEILKALRDRISEKHAASIDFAAAVAAFLKHAQEAINPAVSEDDVREMLIQHILTEDIFAKVFDNPDFHQQNNVARELKTLEDALFERGEKSTLLRALAPYYSGIASTAALISSHSEKQGFLKALYEDFYKAYNKKAADRLGVVYTPGEIVRFMIRSADWLCEQHFGRNLIDPGVEILDPATGTGTFIVELLEHFRGNHDKLRHKYKDELHANEIAILPYYVANLNIEATYQAITGQFAEYENLCLVDTLDNVDALGIHSGHQFDLLGSLSDENIERIKRQNRRKISVIIGNPPYNANQQNENDNNKNRTYAHIDKRIKETYGKRRSSHKTKIYDMYVRFVRWASDRIHDDGVIAFVLNRSFIDKRAFDGLRVVWTEEFHEIYVVDLGGDSRDEANDSTDVFGNRIGTAIVFLVRRKSTSARTVYIAKVNAREADDKLAALSTLGLKGDAFRSVSNSAQGHWLEVDDEGFSTGLRLVASKLSGSVRERRDPAIFSLSSFGAVSNRDEWAYDRSRDTLVDKVRFYISVYTGTLAKLPKLKDADITEFLDYRIKWAADLRGYASSRQAIRYEPNRIIETLYRPYSKRAHYFSGRLNWSLYKMPEFFPEGVGENSAIFFTDRGGRSPFSALASDTVGDLHLCASADGFQAVARYRYAKSGERIENITDWALNKFVAHYGKNGITKDAIFHYVYAVLHDPVYRETYALNLKREFPRIPFYPDFAKWAAWGEALMVMHIGYEEVEPWPVERVDTPAKRAEGTAPKPVLKSHPDQGLVVVDADTQITGIPPEAWSYRLGNRSAIDWVLDQHKEKRPRDPTIAAKFNTYRFADYKESMIALLAKVVRVSIDTVAITDEMKRLDRSGWKHS